MLTAQDGINYSNAELILQDLQPPNNHLYSQKNN